MRNQAHSLWLGVGLFGMLALPALSQDSRPAEAGIPTDWSHRQLIFSRPATPEQARRVQQDPRYWQQRERNQARRPSSLLESHEALRPGFGFGGGNPGPDPARAKTHRDWSQDLGAGGTVGAANSPAKYSFSVTGANCISSGKPDFVVYSTGLLGASAQASIVAYDNLYLGCPTGNVPTVYWAYNTGGQILTSPAFSRDGKQVIFVQTDAAQQGTLVLLKWASSSAETVGSPGTPATVGVGAYRGCTAPCMAKILLKDGSGVVTDDTTSSVFADLSNDTAWVGGDGGWLHKISGIFLGTPGEVNNGVFPVQVNPANPNILTNPVHDFASGSVFVGDLGGFLYAVDSSTAAVTQSAQLDFGVGIIEGPIVDSTAGLVYVFASSDGTGGCMGGADCAAVYQLTTAFAAGDTGSETLVGISTMSGTNPNPMYIGAFDSTYQDSDDATGNLYVCGNTGGPPTLYQVAISIGALGAVAPGPVLSITSTPCSPVTDIFSAMTGAGASEFVFASVHANGTSSACALGGCIFNFNDTPWQPLTAYSVGQQVVDTHFQIQVVNHAGTSGAARPSWTLAVGGSTVDAGVRWLDQGLTSATTPAPWQAGHVYTRGKKILDNNNNIELVTTAGTSGGTMPVWSTTAGSVKVDGTVRWTNVGLIATSALPEAAGTSGIIIDNIVGSGTIVGGSQVYFSTLGNQVCGTSGTGGCAVQASQSTLQ